jgi:hypothetical protein
MAQKVKGKFVKIAGLFFLQGAGLSAWMGRRLGS